MDVISIANKVVTKTISKLVNRTAEKSLGFDPDIELRRFDLAVKEKTRIDISMEMSNENFEKLLEVLTK